MELPGYMAWSERKLGQGVSGALLAHLDAMSMFLLPEEAAAVSDAAFEELLADIAEATGEEIPRAADASDPPQ